jgi:hypothetical protein
MPVIEARSTKLAMVLQAYDNKHHQVEKRHQSTWKSNLQKEQAKIRAVGLGMDIRYRKKK